MGNSYAYLADSGRSPNSSAVPLPTGMDFFSTVKNAMTRVSMQKNVAIDDRRKINRTLVLLPCYDEKTKLLTMDVVRARSEPRSQIDPPKSTSSQIFLPVLKSPLHDFGGNEDKDGHNVFVHSIDMITAFNPYDCDLEFCLKKDSPINPKENFSKSFKIGANCEEIKSVAKKWQYCLYVNPYSEILPLLLIHKGSPKVFKQFTLAQDDIKEKKTLLLNALARTNLANKAQLNEVWTKLRNDYSVIHHMDYILSSHFKTLFPDGIELHEIPTHIIRSLELPEFSKKMDKEIDHFYLVLNRDIAKLEDFLDKVITSQIHNNMIFSDIVYKHNPNMINFFQTQIKESSHTLLVAQDKTETLPSPRNVVILGFSYTVSILEQKSMPFLTGVDLETLEKKEFVETGQAITEEEFRELKL